MPVSDPYPASSRYSLVDSLRGFAIMGILLLHSIEHFNFYLFPDNATQSEWMVEFNGHIWTTMFFLFGGKAYGIFALLFGFTFHLQFSRRASQGIDFGPIFLWRMMILFGFGWINAILFPGEVLLLYALLGPCLYFVRHLENRLLLAVAILFLLQPFEIYQFLQSFLNAEYNRPDFGVDALWGQTFDYIQQGSFVSLMMHCWTGVKATFLWSLEKGRIEQTLGLFVLGVWLGRTHAFSSGRDSQFRWLVTLGISCAMFFGILALEKGWIPSLDGSYRATLATLMATWRNLFQIGVMVSMFCSLYALGWFQWMTTPLRAYGRMSLTNYVMQSVFGGLVFYPYGMGLASKLNTLNSLMLGVGMFLVYLGFCNSWFLLFKFKQGPLEKIWHTLTWLPLKKRRMSPPQPVGSSPGVG